MNRLFLLSIFIILFSCRKVDNLESRHNTLNAVLRSEVSSIDPAKSYDTISAQIVYQVHEALYEYHFLKRPYSIQPLLAKSLPRISPDGLHYTIQLKKGIRFHHDKSFGNNPRYLVAQDLINQIKRLAFKPLASNGWWLFDGKIKGLNDFREKAKTINDLLSFPVQGLIATDSHTLDIFLTKPFPQLVYAFAMSFTAPVPKELILAYKNDFSEVAIGTGPFILKKFHRSHIISLVKNSNYREVLYPSQGDRVANANGLLMDAGKRIPFLDKIKFTVMKESQTRWLNFHKKKIDYLEIPKDNYSKAITESGGLSQEMKKKGIGLKISPSLTYWWNSFNMTDSLVGKNLYLRKAIAHSINTSRYIQLFTNNIGQRANSIYPPGIKGYNPADGLPYEYNIVLARKYLAQAGFPEGKGLPEINYDVRGTTTKYRQRGDFIKNELSKIGIKIKVTLNTFPAFLEKARAGKLQFFGDGWAMDYPDAENSLQILSKRSHPPGPNASFYHNPKFEEYYAELSLLQDGPRKIELMRLMQNLVNKDLPWIMQYYERNYILLHSYLKNFRPDDLITNSIKYLRID